VAVEGNLKGETESEIIAPQDQALPNKLLATRTLQTERDSKCRRCKQFDETVNTSACPKLAKEQHIKETKRACTQLHFNIGKETGVK
jgi:phage FluMu protein Com